MSAGYSRSVIPAVEFSQATFSVTEGATVSVSAVLSMASANNLTFPLLIFDGTAVSTCVIMVSLDMPGHYSCLNLCSGC